MGVTPPWVKLWPCYQDQASHPVAPFFGLDEASYQRIPEQAMHELLRSNDLVLLSFLQTALEGEGLNPILLDHGMSTLDGGVIAIPRRLMVPEDEASRAKAIMAELSKEYGPL